MEALIGLHDQEVEGDEELGGQCGAWIEWNGARGCGVEGAVKVLGLERAKGDIAWDQYDKGSVEISEREESEEEGNPSSSS